VGAPSSRVCHRQAEDALELFFLPPASFIRHIRGRRLIRGVEVITWMRCQGTDELEQAA
jgi:hypothetical protein